MQNAADGLLFFWAAVRFKRAFVNEGEFHQVFARTPGQAVAYKAKRRSSAGDKSAALAGPPEQEIRLARVVIACLLDHILSNSPRPIP
jgi:hypothetical protein